EGSTALMDGDPKRAGAKFDEALAVGERLNGVRARSMPPFVHLLMGDLTRTRAQTERTIAELRVEASMASLVGMLALFAGAEVLERRLRNASATIAEGLELSRQYGYENDETGLLALQARVAALQGREDECREVAEVAMRRSLANGIGWATKNSRIALAELELGLGNPREAIEHLEQIDPSPLPPLAMLETPDLIDAALRAG